MNNEIWRFTADNKCDSDYAFTKQGLDAYVAALTAEKDARIAELTAELASLKAQEPVGYVDGEQFARWQRLRGTYYESPERCYLPFSTTPFESNLTNCNTPLYLAAPIKEGYVSVVEQQRQFLWDLLDDIDTASDMAKANDKWYRECVEGIQRRRFEISSSDGYTVTFNAAPKEM